MFLTEIFKMFSNVIKKESQFPLADRYIADNHSAVNQEDIPSVLNHFLGPQGLRVLTNADNFETMCLEVEDFLKSRVFICA